MNKQIINATKGIFEEKGYYALQKNCKESNKRLLIILVNTDLSWEVEVDPVKRAIEAYSFADTHNFNHFDTIIVGVPKDKLVQGLPVIDKEMGEIKGKLGEIGDYADVKFISAVSTGVAGSVKENNASEHVIVYDDYESFLALCCEKGMIQKHVVNNFYFIYNSFLRQIAGCQDFLRGVAHNKVCYWNMYQILKFIKQQKAEMVVESVLQGPVILSEAYRHGDHPYVRGNYPESVLGSFGSGSGIGFKGFGRNK